MDFFTEEQFNEIKQRIAKEEIFGITDTPFKKEVRINGNTYKLEVHASVNYEGKYYVSGLHDYNFKSTYLTDGRDVGGGTYTPDMTDYQAFKDGLNKLLKKFPDYEEEAQLSLW